MSDSFKEREEKIAEKVREIRESVTDDIDFDGRPEAGEKSARVQEDVSGIHDPIRIEDTRVN